MRKKTFSETEIILPAGTSLGPGKASSFVCELVTLLLFLRNQIPCLPEVLRIVASPAIARSIDDAGWFQQEYVKQSGNKRRRSRADQQWSKVIG